MPDYIVGEFVPANACRRCGRSDLSYRLLFPRLRWGETDIELVYPLRCPCGGSGCVPIKLPTLLFGYILATVALVDVAKRRRSRATMTVSRLSTDVLGNIFRKFDRLLEARSTIPQSPPVTHREQDLPDDYGVDHAERIKFGLDMDEWKAFLVRLGLGGPDSGSSRL